MKLHRPTQTYNRGDKCYVNHTVDGVTQKYTFESLGVQKGVFSPSAWRNVTPRVWRPSTLSLNDFVYEGDTVFVGDQGYKNTRNGVKPLKEFMNPIKGIIGNTRIYALEQTEYLLDFEGYYVANFFLRNSTPDWSNFTKVRSYSIDCLLIADKVFIKALCSGETYDLYGNKVTNTLILNKSSYDWNLITTPATGNSGTQTVSYGLPNTLGDFYYFVLSTSANVLSVERLALNTNP